MAFQNRTRPASDFEIVPDGEYVIECIKAERGYTKKTGNRKVELTLLVEGHACRIFHTLTVITQKDAPGFDLCAWQIDNALLAFGICTPEDKGFEPNFEDDQWVQDNFVGNRSWAKVKKVDDYRDKDKPASDRRKRNEVDEFIIGKELPAPPARPEDPNKPKF